MQEDTIMVFADDLARRTKTKDELREQRKLFCAEMAQELVNKAVPTFKSECLRYADMGKRKISATFSGSLFNLRSNSLKLKYPDLKNAAKDAAEQLEEMLRNEGFKKLSIIPSVFDLDDGDYKIEVRIKAEW